MILRSADKIGGNDQPEVFRGEKLDQRNIILQVVPN